MMSHLPPDLIEEIISRVPATSFKRLRSTCKRWNALFKNPRFIEKHFRKAPKESQALMLNEYRVCTMSVNLDGSPPSIGFGLKNYPPNSEKVYINEVVHCDGLLLCTTMDNRIVVWNPCLGETRWIQPIGYSKYTLGYEKTKSGHIYKILKCRDYFNVIQGRVDECEIYDFSSDSWRVLDGVAFDCYVLSNINGLSLKGNTYWLALDNNKKSRFVLSFDFTAERFTRMCVPPSQDVCKMALSVVRDVQLSVLCQRDSKSKMEMWVTNKIDTDIEAGVLKWSKSFTVDIPIRGDYCPFYVSYLIDEEKKVAVCYNESSGKRKKVYIIGEDNECYTEIPFGKSTHKPWFYPFIFNYVPSLVQIQRRKMQTKRMKLFTMHTRTSFLHRILCFCFFSSSFLFFANILVWLVQ